MNFQTRSGKASFKHVDVKEFTFFKKGSGNE